MTRGKPTTQAQRAIDGLLRAGLKRGDFRVRTEKRRGCYGDASIWIANPQRAVEAIDALLQQGFQVDYFYGTVEPIKGKLLSVIVSDRYNKKAGRLFVHK